MSVDPESRVRQHEPKPWFGQVASATVEWFDSRREAAVSERAAIKAEAPVHNISQSDASRHAGRALREDARAFVAALIAEWSALIGGMGDDYDFSGNRVWPLWALRKQIPRKDMSDFLQFTIVNGCLDPDEWPGLVDGFLSSPKESWFIPVSSV